MCCIGFSIGLSAGEFTVAVITSLVASIVFWLTFDIIPRKVALKKVKPLIDYDLYQVYMKLFIFIETPFKRFENTASLYQNEIFTGILTESEFKLFLSTKCLTEQYQSIDENSKKLMPIGNKLQNITDEIERIINQLYVFNHYLSAKQILICRQILDKLNTYSYDSPAYINDRDGTIHYCINPTVGYMSRMFKEVYDLYLQLQKYLINSNKSEVFANYRVIMESSMISSLFYQGKYKKVCLLIKKTGNYLSQPLYFRSLYLLNRREESKKAMIDFLRHSSIHLIGLRNSFEEVIQDDSMKSILISERSEEEVNDMIRCLNQEHSSKDDFRHFAEKMMLYYCKKETT